MPAGSGGRGRGAHGPGSPAAGAPAADRPGADRPGESRMERGRGGPIRDRPARWSGRLGPGVGRYHCPWAIMASATFKKPPMFAPLT
jgi:hypothetical protein